jgi:hypothetical protein
VRTAFLALALIVLAPLGARAQSAPPDVVRLEDGGLVRGVIVELVPEQYVVISLPDGSTRRYEMSAVEYAGPVQPAEQPSAPVPPPPAGSANQWSGAASPVPTMSAPPSSSGALQLHLTSETPGITLMLQTSIAVAQAGMYSATAYAYERVCTAPCTTELQPGSYQFAVQDARGRQYRVRRPVLLQSDTTLDIGVESRRRQRIVRWVTSITLLGVGAGLLGASFARMTRDDFYDEYDEHPSWGLLGAGSALLIGGSITMSIAILTRDRGKVSFVPQ